MTFFQILVVILIVLVAFVIGYFFGKHERKGIITVGNLVIGDGEDGLPDLYLAINDIMDINGKAQVCFNVVREKSQETQVI